MSRRCMTVLAVLLATAPALATGQSMAEAARKERERREKAAGQKDSQKEQAYTNSDLATAGGGSGTANILSGPSPAAAAPSAATPSLAEARAAAEARAGGPATASTTGLPSIRPTSGAGGQAYWRSRAAGLRQRVSAAQVRLTAADRAMAEFTFGPPEGGGCDGLAESAYRSGGIEGLKQASKRGCKDRAMEWHERRNRAANEFDAAKIELENAKKALDGLDEEARRGGALPGWIR